MGGDFDTDGTARSRWWGARDEASAFHRGHDLADALRGHEHAACQSSLTESRVLLQMGLRRPEHGTGQNLIGEPQVRWDPNLFVRLSLHLEVNTGARVGDKPDSGLFVCSSPRYRTGSTNNVDVSLT